MTTCTHLDHVQITQLPESVQGCEEWSWCFLDDVAPLIPEVEGETRIPPSPLG
jgi:hypothetical protein